MSKFGPWIAHNGDECPVGEDETVLVCLSTGILKTARKAKNWQWGIEITGFDSPIIAYRVLVKPVVKEYPFSFRFRGYPIEIKMVSTDGNREWFIEELDE